MKQQPELRIYVVDVEDLIPYARNAKEHSLAQVDTIAASIEEFGNCDPIAVWHNADGQPEIIEGHGRLLALKKLGHEVAPVIYLDHLSDEQRRAYTHVHNQTTLNSGFDVAVLDLEMMDLPEFDWEQFGFNDGADVLSALEMSDDGLMGNLSLERDYFNITFTFPDETREKVEAYIKEVGKDSIVDLIVEKAGER